MNSQTLELIHSVFSAPSYPFSYAKDDYARHLLAWYVGSEGKLLREIKRSPFAPLLTRAAIAPHLRTLPNGHLTAARLLRWPRNPARTYPLTFGQWSDYDRKPCQISRRGMNLVLQVNFPLDHNRLFRRLLEPHHPYIFANTGHPINRSGRFITLAWARIDLDLRRPAALIEEIQSDWLRELEETWAVITNPDSEPDTFRYYTQGFTMDRARLGAYRNAVLAPYRELWPELTLWAAIDFLYHELGIRVIFYHTAAMGSWIKRGGNPPLSLYSELPHRFCFRPTGYMPAFLFPALAGRKPPRPIAYKPLFYMLELPQPSMARG